MKSVALAILAGLAAPAMAQTAPVPDGPAKLNSSGALFGVRESVQQMDISPDGSKVVYLTPGRGRVTAVYVADLAGGVPQLAMTSSGSPDRLHWCHFVTNQRLVCELGGVVDNNGGALIGFSRLFAVDIDGKNGKPLGQRGTMFDESVRYADGQVIDWLPDEHASSVLMARDYVPELGNHSRLARTAKGLGIDRVDVTTMKSVPVEAPAMAVKEFFTDGHGVVRMKRNQATHGVNGQLSSLIDYNYRVIGSKDWRQFGTYDQNTGEGMIVLDIDGLIDSAYVLKKLDGRYALYRVKLDGSMASELVYSNPKVDVDSVFRLANGSPIIGLSYDEDTSKVIYFDDAYAKLAAALGKALPKLPQISFISASADNSKLLLLASSDSDPGRYYVFDKSKRGLNEIMLARPALENVPLATVKSITYQAADGTVIPAYLTLPPGKETARGLPAVILPHGGPSSRDVWGFDWLPQYLAHEGYAVLQPEYRGSEGYGDAWLRDKGWKQWRTSIGDVTDGAKWLAKQGIANPDKMAIVGWSYGGYAALQAGVTEPSLFKAIVAIAPVTDLEMLKLEESKYNDARLLADLIGSGPHTVEGSPLQNVDKIAAPVMLFHGSMDMNVPIEQSTKMDAKLRAAGKHSELVTYAGLEHSLVDSNVRAQMLDKIGAFLKANLNP